MKRTILIITMLIIAAASGWAQDAEIIYNDDIPLKEMRADAIFPYTHRIFDFDEDSDRDFFIAWSRYKEYHIIAYTYGSWWFETQILEIGDTIPTISNWYPKPENPDYDPTIYFSPGFSRDSIIIGFRNQVADDEFCYGWIRFSLDAGSEMDQISSCDVPWCHGICTFIDYAYCTQPNYPLRAGQTSYNWDRVNEKTSEHPFASIHPNPTTGIAIVRGENLRQAEVLNMLGQRVAAAKNNEGRLTVDLIGLPAGVYFVNIIDEDGRKCVRKVVKQ